jgi:hypothetical protein
MGCVCRSRVRAIEARHTRPNRFARESWPTRKPPRERSLSSRRFSLRSQSEPTSVHRILIDDLSARMTLSATLSFAFMAIFMSSTIWLARVMTPT